MKDLRAAEAKEEQKYLDRLIERLSRLLSNYKSMDQAHVVASQIVVSFHRKERPSLDDVISWAEYCERTLPRHPGDNPVDRESPAVSPNHDKD